jgi:uncharacterized damage-inducible protein DinB
MANKNQSTDTAETIVITPEDLLGHWQGHRRLTRRVIELYPDDKLFTYSIGGMRPFSTMISELLGMAVPSLKGIITGTWQKADDMLNESKTAQPASKKEFLQRWDETTQQINELWPQIPPHRFQEVDTAFGQWKSTIHFLLFYVIDNEIHHRAQVYVYLRSLGIEPPPFWERE